MSLHTERADPLRFSVRKPRADVTVVNVAGEVDLATAQGLRSELARVFDCGTAMLVLDLSPVTFLGAAGLTVLAEMQAEAARSRRDMVLITRARAVDRAIEVTGLAARLRRVGSLTAALAERPAYGDETGS